MKSLRYALTFVLLSMIASLYSQEQLVNRRVMLVNFTNLQNKADFEYLEISIPEAMLIALDDTKNFDLLQVSTWDKLVESGKYTKSDTKKDARVQAAGLSQGADVVVLGSFANIGQDLKITARAIEAKSGRLIVTKSVLAKTDGSMFGSIDNLSIDMAKEMKNKLPPLPPREIIRERIVKEKEEPKIQVPITTNTLVRLSAGKAFPENSYHKTGFNRIALDFFSPWPTLPFGSLLYAQAAFRLLPAYTTTTNLPGDTNYQASILNAGLGLAYRYRISNRWSTSATVGACLSIYRETSTILNVQNKDSSESIGVQASLSVEYALFQRTGLFAGVFYSYEPIGSAQTVNIGGAGAKAGVTYRQ